MSQYWKEMEVIAKKPASPGTEEILFPLTETLIKRVRTGSQWTFWIAGISAVNVLFTYLQLPIRLSFGLIFPELAYEVGHQIGAVFVGVALLVITALLGALVALGFQAKKYQLWAFATALGFVCLDAGLLIWLTGFARFGSIAIHLWCIYATVVGLQAAKTYHHRAQFGIA